MLELDSNTTLLAQLEIISKQLVATTIIPTNVSLVKTLRCDFCGEGHAIGNFVPKDDSFKTRYAKS